MPGPIPTEIGQCSRLEQLALNGNELTGLWHFVIVWIDAKPVSHLTEMYDMTGTIPTEIGRCCRLETLQLNVNHLTGLWHFEIALTG